MAEIDLAALEREALAAEAEAHDTVLSDEERAAASLRERITKAREKSALAGRTRRQGLIDKLEREIRPTVGPRTLVKGIDLVDLFPVGVAPDAKTMPGEGVIVVSSPAPERLKDLHREIEHKARPLADLYTDLICESTEHPKVKDAKSDAEQNTNAQRLRKFFEDFPGAAIGAGDVVGKLGGAKAQADKRGHG